MYEWGRVELRMPPEAVRKDKDRPGNQFLSKLPRSRERKHQ